MHRNQPQAGGPGGAPRQLGVGRPFPAAQAPVCLPLAFLSRAPRSPRPAHLASRARPPRSAPLPARLPPQLRRALLSLPAPPPRAASLFPPSGSSRPLPLSTALPATRPQPLASLPLALLPPSLPTFPSRGEGRTRRSCLPLSPRRRARLRALPAPGPPPSCRMPGRSACSRNNASFMKRLLPPAWKSYINAALISLGMEGPRPPPPAPPGGLGSEGAAPAGGLARPWGAPGTRQPALGAGS